MGAPLLLSCRQDLTRLLDLIEPGELRDGVATCVRPLTQALDDLSGKGGDYVPLTALAQFNWDVRRLDISIQPPPYAAEPQLIELQCFLDAAFVSRRSFDEAANRGVALIIAPLRPDLRALVGGSERLKSLIVAAADHESRVPAARERAVSTLEMAIYKRRSPRVGAQPLQYNFAREFPLHNPFLTRYFHVYRSSVRELLKDFQASQRRETLVQYSEKRQNDRLCRSRQLYWECQRYQSDVRDNWANT